MPLPRSDLVILVARRRESAVFLDVLRDWSALGLIADFLLVDADAPLGSGGGSPCMGIARGRISSSSLQETLAARRAISSAHVVCLSQVDDEFSTVGADRGFAVLREVRNALPSSDVTWVHAIGIAQPTAWPQVDCTELGWLGCHNVLLVPENSRSPQAGVAQVPATPITPVRLTQQAAALCSAVGLWVVERRTPFGGEPPAGGGQLIALRTYTRHLDAGAVTSRLVARAVDVERKYPVPSVEGRPAQRFDDQAGAAEGMAIRLLAKHDSLLARSRSLPPRQPPEKISLLRLIAMFLRFFYNALRRAPRDFADSMMHRASEEIAAAAQGALLGRGDSAYIVTVNGIRGIKQDGSVATPEEYDAELENLLAQVKGRTGAVSPEQHDYTGFWKDFMNGALTLLDAGRRSNGLEADQVGAGEGVVTDPRLVIVPPTDVFEIPPDVRAVAKVSRVSPHDVDAGRRTYDLLRERAQEQSERTASLTATQNQLRGWFEERQRSYGGKIGERLSAELTKVREEIRDYVQALQNVNLQTRVPPEYASLQQSLAKVLVAHASVFALFVVVTLFLSAMDIVPWRYGVPIAVVLVLVWLVSATGIFTRRQQSLFQLRNRRQSDAELAVAQKENLGAALEDLRRLQRVYRQYLDWAGALGTFLQAPWGYAAVSDEAPSVLGEGYPHNHRFGVAMPDEAAIDDVVSRLRPQLFPVAWLSRAWAAFSKDVPQMGADRHLLIEAPDLIFSDRAVSQTSLLTQWSEAVRSRSWTGGAQTVRLDIEEALGRSSSHHDRLLSRVRSRAGDGSLDVESYQAFVEGLQEVVSGPVIDQRFSRAIFSDVPETPSPWTVAEAMSNHSGAAIPESLIVTQISNGFSARDLGFCRPNSPDTGQPSTKAGPTLSPPQV